VQKELVAEIFGTSGKNIQHFTMDTPEKRKVEGWICKSRGSNMGSLIIENVDGVNVDSFIRGMPKIKYLDEREEPSIPYVLNKEDGTNIVHFPLIVDNDCVETLFKTRLMPYANPNWMTKIEEVITPNHYRMVENLGLSMAYELYGTKNKHEVNYDVQGIDLALSLLCILDQGRALTYPAVKVIADKYGVDRVIEAFEVDQNSIGEYYTCITPQFDKRYADYIPKEDSFEGNLIELYHKIESFFEQMNMKFQDKHSGGIIVEGSVWNYGEDETHFAKCKAISVREGHIKSACGIPHISIRKAITKGEENNPDFEEMYRMERDKVIAFIKDELLEEYPKLMVEDKKSNDKIKSVLHKHFVKVILDNELIALAQKVVEEVGEEASPADKMRAFSEMYPEQRKLASKMYQTFVNM
jgi:hypothetical protein